MWYFDNVNDIYLLFFMLVLQIINALILEESDWKFFSHSEIAHISSFDKMLWKYTCKSYLIT